MVEAAEEVLAVEAPFLAAEVELEAVEEEVAAAEATLEGDGEADEGIVAAATSFLSKLF